MGEINEASCCSKNEAATYVIVHLKYVSINYREAITNFDTDHLPVIFVYYNGALEHQDMKFDIANDKYYIQRRLSSWGIIDSQHDELLVMEQDNKLRCNHFKYKSRHSLFGGMNTTFATQNYDHCMHYEDDL